MMSKVQKHHTMMTGNGEVLHPVSLFDFSDIDEPPAQPKRKPSRAHSRAIPVNDIDFLDDLFDDEPVPDFTGEERLELHKALLEKSCEQLHEAIEQRDLPLIRDILSWFSDPSWRPYGFRVCAALTDVDPEVFLYQTFLNLQKKGITEEILCLNPSH
ncbi:hypothetical protein [Acidithiobacillus thiooxidans]|jgi:hypothetical protein|uniref:Uncharacterized protein n=1 Tax=Acidithiobacillus thiooxidans ATCC 19377 TaxID=637390 RepID=A0A5P9XRB2_ACITH|nr:hypothetical protein [Acidithiobacillus thiooxidans]QFX96250.1 hypothetical protein GCD22_01990 [Acidithiobacillus thiooxidans ATCC 19377]